MVRMVGPLWESMCLHLLGLDATGWGSTKGALLFSEEEGRGRWKEGSVRVGLWERADWDVK